MSHLNYIDNFHHDLLRSQTTPLLIELNQDDIKRLYKGATSAQLQSLPVLVAQQTYNKNRSDKATDILLINADAKGSSASFVLLDTMLEQLRSELKGIKNLATLKESLKAAASVATGGMLNDFIGDQLDKGMDFIFDEVGEHFSKMLTDVVGKNMDLSKTVLSNVENLLHDNLGNSLGDVLNKVSQQQLYLSSTAKAEINLLSNAFSKSQKPDIFQLAFKLLLAIGLDAPKLIYVNNPHQLDDNSLALLSLLFSFAKNQKDQDKHVGISVVYAYTDDQFQLYDEVKDTLKNKQQLLAAQRRFVQRYAMLERPSSDIPTVAVKSSLFIGRDEELDKLSAQFVNRKPTTLSVISGEPGIGKTALVNQHVASIHKQGRTIALTLLNEVGHSSSNTGLSSLEKSILDEAKRLELLNGWKDKSRSFVKNMATKENAIKAIGTIFSGADKALSIADAGYQRLMVDNHLDKVKQNSAGDLDNKQGNEKQRQFNNLDKAIEKLKGISSEPLPMVLFIDDLQWIDNTASEYILTRLLSQPDLYIVATLRPSDAATILKEQQTNPSLYASSLALLKACEVRGWQDCSEDIDIRGLLTEKIALSGFDKTALTQLITKVVQGESAKQQALANAIFSALAGADANDVNTLFAIETVNMLCDAKLYSENTLDRLILQAPLRFNPDVTDVEAVLAQTFTTLQNKYQDSLSHASRSTSGQSFNLMAYAVLEERLHLLKLYFGEQGNTAVNTLLFSSLLGAPFSSDLVKKVMDAVINSDTLELQPLRQHLGSNHLDGNDLSASNEQTYLRPEHYAIIDEVYEILRRLSTDGDKYQYRHGLLHTFLDKQFDYLLDSVLVESTVKAKDELIGLILTTVKDVKVQLDLDYRVISSLTSEQIRNMQFYQNVELNVFAKGFTLNPDVWAMGYTAILNNLSYSYMQNSQFSDAIALEEKALVITARHYAKAPDVWAVGYTNNLNNLAASYRKISRANDAIALEEKALLISEKYYARAPSEWADIYTTVLDNLANSYRQNNQVSKAIPLVEKALEISEPYYAEAPDVWARSFTTILVNLALSYKENYQVSDAVRLYKKALVINEHYYAKDPDEWAKGYTANLGNLADVYRIRQTSEAIELDEKALEISELYYAKAPGVWAGKHTTILGNLAYSYKENGQVSDAISIEEQQLKILEQYYDNAQDVWVKDYATALNNLALSYHKNKQVAKAITLFEKVIAIYEQYYAKSPDEWVNNYAVSLYNLAGSYFKNGQLSDAISDFEKVFAIYEHYYAKAPDVWAKQFRNIFQTLAGVFQQKNQANDTSELQEDNIAIFEKRYTKALTAAKVKAYADKHMLSKQEKSSDGAVVPKEAIYDPVAEQEEEDRFERDADARVKRAIANILQKNSTKKNSTQKNSAQQNNQSSDTIKHEEKSPAISELNYATLPTSLVRKHTGSMRKLASSYKQKKQYREAIKLEEKLLAMHEHHYTQAPDIWAKDYTSSLNNLAFSYYYNNQANDAVALEERSLVISELYYAKDPDAWAANHLTSLGNLAFSYKQKRQVNDAIRLEEKALAIGELYYARDPAVWAKECTITLGNLAVSYKQNNQEREAMQVLAKRHAIYEQQYAKAADKWANDYNTSLNGLIVCYQRNNQISEVTALLESRHVIHEHYYTKEPVGWAKHYTKSRNDLIAHYEQNNQMEKAASLKEKVIAAPEVKNPGSWAEGYTTTISPNYSIPYSYKQNK
ncbi:MAG: hypothetical protein ACI808_001385 [Paraglaciecola sp.]|jgi:hypothetical protein